MATLKDVSRAAGVSLTQASRALGGHSDVSAETRRRVEEAARDLRYRPNLSARALRSGRSGLVALVAEAPAGDEGDDVLLEIVTGVSAAVAGQGLRLMLHVLQPGEDAADAHERLHAGGGVDGFVVIDPREGDRRIARLRRIGAVFAVHGRPPEGAHPGADIDNAAAAERMAAHLLGLGHRRIALIEGPADMTFARDRAWGFARALAAAGLAPDPALVRHGRMTAAEGGRAAAALLSWADPPTALVCGNAMLAEGALRAAAARLEVPRQLSLLAHDDGLRRHDPARLVPPVGGSRSPLAEAWPHLAEGLAAALEGRAPPQRVLVPGFRAGAGAAPPDR